MKRFFALLLLLCAAAKPGFAQAPRWTWAKGNDNTGIASTDAIAVDGSGNVYAVGTYNGSLSFDGVNVMAQGITDLYLLKYSPSGTLLWAHTVGGRGSQLACYAIAADVNGDVYISGYFKETAKFGDTLVTSVGGKDIFLAKYRPDGGFAWVRAHGTIYDDVVQSGIGVDSRHNVLISGFFCAAGSSPPQHETITFGNYHLTSFGNSDIFISKYNSDGNVIWAKQAGDKDGEYGFDLAIDKQDNIYVTGIFNYSCYFDSIDIISISSGFIFGDPFLAKYDSSGKAIWAKPIGGRKQTGGTSGGVVEGTVITVDGNGNPIIGGLFSDCDINFGSYYLPGMSNGTGTYDMWLARYSSSGEFIWAQGAGSLEPDYLWDMTSDNAGNVYIVGQYGYNCVFDNDTGRIPLNGAYYYLFVAKYDSTGKLSWLKTGGSTDDAACHGVAVGNSGEVIACGVFGGASLAFDSRGVANTGGINGNGFVAKMSAATGVEIPSSAAGPVISPNPAKGQISISGLVKGRYSRFSVVNTLGQSLMAGQLSGEPAQTVRLPEVPDGIYYIRFSGKDVSPVTQKFIIQH